MFRTVEICRPEPFAAIRAGDAGLPLLYDTEYS
jgi:hypothetical protein